MAGVPYRAPSASDMTQTHPYTRRVPMLLTDATAACSRLPCSTGGRVLSPTALQPLHPPTLTAVSASATPRFPHSPADTSSVYAVLCHTKRDLIMNGSNRCSKFQGTVPWVRTSHLLQVDAEAVGVELLERRSRILNFRLIGDIF